MPKIGTAAAAWGIATLAAMLGATPAVAKITCKDGYQLVAGSWLSTPYCRDNQVAEVARQYGVRVSNAQIRNSPSTKEHVCRIVGHDIRVQQSCLEVLPTPRGRF